MQYPQRRTEGVLEHAIDDEVVVYDTTTDQAHLLNPPTAAVWRAMTDGAVATDVIAAATDAPVEVVELALAELARVGLLDAAPVVGPRRGLTRRQALRALGAAAVAAPVIITLSAPPVAAQAQCNQVCEGFGDPTCANSLGTCDCAPDVTSESGFRCQSIGPPEE